MDTMQIRHIKRAGTLLAVGLVMLSVGLMLLGWTVPRKWAFEAGVFGFQLFPIAVSAIVVRMVLPLLLNTALGRRLDGLAWSLSMRLKSAIDSWRLGRCSRAAGK